MARIEKQGAEPRVLLVEGQDDKHVVVQICNRDSSIPDFYIQDRPSGSGDDSGGIDPLCASIGAELIVPGRQIVGIMLDADDNATDNWNKVRNRLVDAQIEPPDAPDPNGTIIWESAVTGSPRVGIWLMPDNSSSGELEDFIVQMMPSNDFLWPLSRNYISQIPLDRRKFPPSKALRAEIHSWLAASNDPRRVGRMGQAIGAKDLEIHGTLCKTFTNWLSRLFA